MFDTEQEYYSASDKDISGDNTNVENNKDNSEKVEELDKLYYELKYSGRNAASKIYTQEMKDSDDLKMLIKKINEIKESDENFRYESSNTRGFISDFLSENNIWSLYDNKTREIINNKQEDGVNIEEFVDKLEELSSYVKEIPEDMLEQIKNSYKPVLANQLFNNEDIYENNIDYKKLMELDEKLKALSNNPNESKSYIEDLYESYINEYIKRTETPYEVQDLNDLVQKIKGIDLFIANEENKETIQNNLVDTFKKELNKELLKNSKFNKEEPIEIENLLSTVQELSELVKPLPHEIIEGIRESYKVKLAEEIFKDNEKYYDNAEDFRKNEKYMKLSKINQQIKDLSDQDGEYTSYYDEVYLEYISKELSNTLINKIDMNLLIDRALQISDRCPDFPKSGEFIEKMTEEFLIRSYTLVRGSFRKIDSYDESEENKNKRKENYLKAVLQNAEIMYDIYYENFLKQKDEEEVENTPLFLQSETKESKKEKVKKYFMELAHYSISNSEEEAKEEIKEMIKNIEDHYNTKSSQEQN